MSRDGSERINDGDRINGLFHLPGTQTTSIFEGQPPKTRPFPIKTRVIWVLGTYKWDFLLG